jgi:hypothetical protein
MITNKRNAPITLLNTSTVWTETSTGDRYGPYGQVGMPISRSEVINGSGDSYTEDSWVRSNKTTCLFCGGSEVYTFYFYIDNTKVVHEQTARIPLLYPK